MRVEPKLYKYTHTHTLIPLGGLRGQRGEGPQAVFVYMLVLFLPFPKSGFFDVIIQALGKGILYVFVYIYLHFLFRTEMCRNEPILTETNRDEPRMNRDEPRYCQISLLRGKSDNPE